MQKEIVEKGQVLDSSGRIVPGYSTKEILEYNKDNINTKPWRNKEWDFYQIRNDKYCLQFTIGHAAYVGQVGIMFFDIENREWILDESVLLPLVFNRLNMPNTASKKHTIEYNKKKMYMKFAVDNGKHHIICKYKDFEADIVLQEELPNSIVVNIPFNEDKRMFYYNHKIACMSVNGKVKNNNVNYDLNDGYGLLDWGRGVWPFSNEWYWSSISTHINGIPLSLNLGAGFGDTSNATENIVFYGDKILKLGNVYFDVPENYTDVWRIYDEDEKINLVLEPMFDRITRAKILWIDNCTHQVFGRFSGSINLDSDTTLELKGVVDFAEHANNNW